MKKIYRIFIFLIILFFCNIKVYAISVDELKPVEYTDEYKKFLELSEEEKMEYSIIPSPYSVPSSNIGSLNPIKKMAKVGASNETRFSLRDNGWLPNLRVRDQNPTTLCWAFSSLSSLETNLSLKNKSTYYDFSESHMDYSTTRDFINNIKNKYGISRLPGEIATWYTPVAYLTNGQGAINESDMPFDNYKEDEAQHNKINISNIQNKTVQSEVYDINFYPSDLSRSEAIEEIKKNIKLHGSVAAQVYGANIFSNYYNNSTGAIYREDDARNHAVSIIGWDDNYPVSNFNSLHRPTQPGAWIVRNSWGETMDVNGNTINIGDQGFMYISYEDGSIYKSLIDVANASTEISYDNIYQYDEQGYVDRQMTLQNQNKIYLGNYYSKKTSGIENLTHIGILATQTYTCKVYVNPNGKSMAKSDLQQVTLKEGNGQTETFNAGYHTLEFKDPITLSSDEFAVVVEISGTGNVVSFALEANYGDLYPDNSIYEDYTDIEISDSKCFLTSPSSFESNTWIDLTKMHELSSSQLNSDSTIKAFTINKVVDTSLKNIVITQAPNKTNYVEGENFDSTGMAVTAYYNDGSSKTLDSSEYSLSGGTNLKLNQTSVTITFDGKSTSQSIQVTARPTSTPTPVVTPTTTPTITPTPVVTPTTTPTITPTPVVTPTTTPTITPTPVVTPSATPTITPTPITTPTITPTPSPTNENPQNSSFNNITVVVDALNKDSMKITLNNFNQNKNNEKMDYYYYISDSKNENTSRVDYIKINNARIVGNSLQFVLNKNDIQNFSKLELADKVYLYIKEVAIIGSNQSIQTSAGIELKLSSTTITDKNIDFNNPQSGVLSINDDTVAKESIPQAGVSYFIILVIIFITIGGIIIFIRYNILKRQ